MSQLYFKRLDCPLKSTSSHQALLNSLVQEVKMCIVWLIITREEYMLHMELDTAWPPLCTLVNICNSCKVFIDMGIFYDMSQWFCTNTIVSGILSPTASNLLASTDSTLWSMIYHPGHLCSQTHVYECLSILCTYHMTLNFQYALIYVHQNHIFAQHSSWVWVFILPCFGLVAFLKEKFSKEYLQASPAACSELLDTMWEYHGPGFNWRQAQENKLIQSVYSSSQRAKVTHWKVGPWQPSYFPLKHEWNRSYPDKNSFKLQNKPHWTVHSNSHVLHCFRKISPKTTVMGQKLALSEISLDLMETIFFVQRKLGQTLTKTVLHLKMSHILLIKDIQVFWIIRIAIKGPIKLILKFKTVINRILPSL